MTDVIQLASQDAVEHPAVMATVFLFDLASPDTYLAAERVERRFGDAGWQPAVVERGTQLTDDELERVRSLAEQRARQLRMPLVWPERFPAAVPRAMRVATFAAESGATAAFAIAAGRLAFCGGFDVEDAAILADAAAAAGIDVKQALAAAEDPRRDVASIAAGRELRAHGGMTLPALRHDDHFLCGEEQIAAALIARPRAVAEPPTAA